ncbi:50S ribosomal protein L17 [Patescibacteria group bacterium]
MRKRVFGRKLSRGSGSRRALKRSLIRALVMYGSIKTTKTKAKFVIRDIDKLITIAKKGDVTARRRVYAATGNNRGVTEGIFQVTKAFSDQSSGFTKFTSLGLRKGDNTEMVSLEWTKNIVVDKKPKVAKKLSKKTKQSKKQPKRTSKSLKDRLTRKKPTDKNKAKK